ncbi:MAG: NADH-quinone oxidoreductase subunit L [Myxococcota bacterium]
MVEFDTLFLIPFLPLCGAAILGLFGRRIECDLASLIALAAVFGAFAVTCIASYTVFERDAAVQNFLWSWIKVGRLGIDLTLGLDRLSATLMLVVTGVGFLIHLYSTGYMADDPSYNRYFAYLNLFIFAMSVLVLGRSLPVMFIGWEGVGLASYLLIGFWFADEAKARAGRKAFVVNRIGDFGFLLGIFSLLALFGTADFVELERAVKQAGATPAITSGIFSGWTYGSVITFACCSLFVGACGKSAQIPLYVWLPDAMAGPTPVSALIHAATMVTAGVYMCTKLNFLFDLSPFAQNLVAWTGALTAIFAASIGLAQNDIKKVLAYSTVSQLGYMFLAVGVGAYTAGMFHLITHAFFKACLFLGSGAVIHALHGEQDVRKMGGLKEQIPTVYWTFFISTLALAGVTPLSGFWSKDLILAHALERSPALFAIGLSGAGLTAFYMSRLVALTFYGEYRGQDPHMLGHLHHPNAAMRWPLIILAGLAVVGGALNLPHFLPGPHEALEHWYEPILGDRPFEMAFSTELALMAASTVVAISGLYIGYAIYRHGPSAALEKSTRTGPMAAIHKLILNKYYVDEIYEATVVPAVHVAGRIAAGIDHWLIDGVLAWAIPRTIKRGFGQALSWFQNGNVQAYATMFVFAAAILSAWVLYVSGAFALHP